MIKISLIFITEKKAERQRFHNLILFNYTNCYIFYLSYKIKIIFITKKENILKLSILSYLRKRKKSLKFATIGKITRNQVKTLKYQNYKKNGKPISNIYGRGFLVFINILMKTKYKKKNIFIICNKKIHKIKFLRINILKKTVLFY